METAAQRVERHIIQGKRAVHAGAFPQTGYIKWKTGKITSFFFNEAQSEMVFGINQEPTFGKSTANHFGMSESRWVRENALDVIKRVSADIPNEVRDPGGAVAEYEHLC